MVTIISWNVNSLNKLVLNNKKQLDNLITHYKPNFLFLQETKLNNQIYEINNYTSYFNSNNGYAGVALYVNYNKKFKVLTQFKNPIFNGRLIIVYIPDEDLAIINVYVPNSGKDLKNLSFRANEWNKHFTKLIKATNKLTKRIIICGDLNVAHNEIDLANPVQNRNKTAGFTDVERNDFTELLKLKPVFIDLFRYNNPNTIKYSFWTRRSPQARSKNIGWRLDYFLVSTQIKNKMDTDILTDVEGSDHAPIILFYK